MVGILITETVLKDLFGHLTRWLVNLGRAGPTRKAESRKALQDVIRAIRQTKVYTRELVSKEARNFAKEEKLSLLWTNLSFELERLGLEALAKRCRIKGHYWADPDQFTEDFLKKAKVRLEDMEKQARKLLNDIK